MTVQLEKVYLKKVQKALQHIKLGDSKNLEKASKTLEELENYRPYRLKFLLAKALLELKTGKNPLMIRGILDNILSELCYDENLSELFNIKAQTYPAKSLGEKSCKYCAKLYQSKMHLPLKNKDLENAQENFLLDNLNPQKIDSLAAEYYINRNYLVYFILKIFAQKLLGNAKEYDNYIEEDVSNCNFGAGIKEINLGVLAKILTEGKKHTFVIVEEEETFAGMLLTYALKNLSMTVIYLSLQLPLLKGEKEEETLSRSLKTLQETDGYFKISLAPLKGGKTNANLLLQYIKENLLQEDFAIFLAKDAILDDTLKNTGQRLSYVLGQAFQEHFSFGFLGLYTSFYSYLYEFNVAEKIKAQSTCQISIVIPVKNPSKTLLYTLKTCLEQETTATYEIILSDNSDPEEDAVYKLYQQIGSPKIKYVRPPFSLQLTKSFEYALLQANGEFIFSIGSDDAIFPWTVEILSQLVHKHPDVEIFHWMRGFYAYPGFNLGQENQLIVQLMKEPINTYLYDGKKYLQSYLANDISVYIYPMLYINSGFRRKFFHTLIKKTGALLQGSSQDVYTGLVSLLATDTPILDIAFPLAIAGMSNTSIGFNSKDTYEAPSILLKKNAKNKLKISKNLAYYAYTKEELKIPFITEDVDNYLLSLAYIRLKSQNIIDQDTEKAFNLEKKLLHIIDRIDKDDLLFEKKWNLANYALELSKYDSLHQKFTKLRNDIFTPSLKEQELPYVSTQKLYQEAFLAENHHLTIDASRYNVQNIYDAMQLSVRFIKGKEKIPTWISST